MIGLGPRCVVSFAMTRMTDALRIEHKAQKCCVFPNCHVGILCAVRTDVTGHEPYQKRPKSRRPKSAIAWKTPIAVPFFATSAKPYQSFGVDLIDAMVVPTLDRRSRTTCDGGLRREVQKCLLLLSVPLLFGLLLEGSGWWWCWDHSMEILVDSGRGFCNHPGGWFPKSSSSASSYSIVRYKPSTATTVARQNRNQTTQRPLSGAFSLLVTLEFTKLEWKDQFLQEIVPVANYVHSNEPQTLCYQVLHPQLTSMTQKPSLPTTTSRSSRTLITATTALVWERYQDKQEAYLTIHKSSRPFATFRTKLQEMANQQRVQISGHSYRDLLVATHNQDVLESQDAVPYPTTIMTQMTEIHCVNETMKRNIVVPELIDLMETHLRISLNTSRQQRRRTTTRTIQTMSLQVLESDQDPTRLLVVHRYRCSMKETTEPIAIPQLFDDWLKNLVHRKTIWLQTIWYIDTSVGFVDRSIPT